MNRRIFLLLAAAITILPASGQNLLPNGDFEQADPAHPGKPAHWDQPDGLGVQWIDAPAVPGAPPHGKAIRMNTAISETAMVDSYTKAGLTQWVFPKPAASAIGETYGLSLYSDPVPVVAGKTYRISFDYFSPGGTGGKVWMRAYALVNGEKKRVYEGTVDCGGGPGGWHSYNGTFHPTRYRPNVAEFRIMLFACFPDGVAWFDNVKVEAFDEPASP